MLIICCIFGRRKHIIFVPLILMPTKKAMQKHNYNTVKYPRVKIIYNKTQLFDP